MAEARKVIITCAVTDRSTPTMSPPPITRSDRGERHRRGAPATVLHLARSARRPADAGPRRVHAVSAADPRRDRRDHQHHYRRFGRHDPRGTARGARACSQMCSLNMGSMNSVCSMAGRYETWQYDWEPRYLELARQHLQEHVPRYERILRELARLRTVSSSSATTSDICTLAHFLERGWSNRRCSCRRSSEFWAASAPIRKPAAHARSPTSCSAVELRVVDSGAGRHQMNLVTIGATMGGHVRWDSRTALPRARRAGARQCRAVRKIRGILKPSRSRSQPRRSPPYAGPQRTDRVAF